jgi:hypothetical protein
MPIFFEKRQRGEDSVLSIYGTTEELDRFAGDLKERLALRHVQRKPDQNLGVPNLKSSSFTDVEVLVVTAEEAKRLKMSERRKKHLIVAVWLIIVAVVIALCLLGGKNG